LFIFNINIRILSHPLNSHRRQKLIDLFFTHFFGMAFFMEENESLVPKNIGLLGAETVVLGANHFSNLIQQLWLCCSWWLECLIRHETYPIEKDSLFTNPIKWCNSWQYIKLILKCQQKFCFIGKKLPVALTTKSRTGFVIKIFCHE